MNQTSQALSQHTTAEHIAQVALEILEAEGAEAVSMRRVASAVDITPMAIYHYFPNREALLNHITDREFSKLLEYILAHPLRGNSEARIIRILEGISITPSPVLVCLTMFSPGRAMTPGAFRKIFARAVLQRSTSLPTSSPPRWTRVT